MKIRARNNLGSPVRLTLTITSGEPEILITIGKEGVRLAGFYSICSDTDLLPSEDWCPVGNLEIETKHSLKINGEIKE